MTDQEKFWKARSVFHLLYEFDKRSEDLTSLLDDDYLHQDYNFFVRHLQDCLQRLGYHDCLSFSGGSETYQLRDSSNKVVYSLPGVVA